MLWDIYSFIEANRNWVLSKLQPSIMLGAE